MPSTNEMRRLGADHGATSVVGAALIAAANELDSLRHVDKCFRDANRRLHTKCCELNDLLMRIQRMTNDAVGDLGAEAEYQHEMEIEYGAERAGWDVVGDAHDNRHTDQEKAEARDAMDA